MSSSIKSILASGAYMSGILRLFGSIKQARSHFGNVTVLMYHRVVESLDSELAHTSPGMMVSQNVFEDHLTFLRDHFNIITLAELADTITAGRKPRDRSVVITFDDGWRDNYTLAFPLLVKHAIPATVFLTTDYIGTSDTFWFHKIGLALGTGKMDTASVVDSIRQECEIAGEKVPAAVETTEHDTGLRLDSLLEALKGISGETVEKIANRIYLLIPEEERLFAGHRWMLNWDEVNAMSGDLVDFGSHGLSHRIMTTLDDTSLRDEMVKSREAIFEQTGQRPTLIAYPNGNFDPRIVTQARSAGYAGGVTTDFDIGVPLADRAYAIRRVGVHEGMSVDNRGRFSPGVFALGLSGWKQGFNSNV